MALNTIAGDLRVQGTLQVTTFIPPNASIGDGAVTSADPIMAEKVQHQYCPTFAQPNTTATSETRVIHVARGAGTIEAFDAGSIAACVGAATVTVNLKKNGTTVLSAVITLDSGNTTRVIEAGTVSVMSIAAGDVLEVVTVATAGGGTLATGVFARAVIREFGS